MRDLTGKQKRMLKGLGQGLKPSAHIGKAGLSKGLLQQIDELLRRHELVKIRLGEGDRHERKETANQIAVPLAAAFVSATGRTALFYRASEELPESQRIHLP